MKRVFIYTMVISFLISCKSQFPIAYDPNRAKNKDYKCYIKPKKGDIIAGENIEKKNEGKFFKPTLFTINGSTFKAKEIQEYQDNTGLYTNVDGSLTQALTGPRMYVFRKLETYTTFENGHSSTHVGSSYYIKKAGQDEYVMVSLKGTKKLKDWVEDNYDAYDEAMVAYRLTKKIRIHRLISWGAVIGGIAMAVSDPAAKNADPSKKVGVVGYTGLGLLGGGIINLNLNAFSRRRKVGRAYAEAINLYNATPAKTRK